MPTAPDFGAIAHSIDASIAVRSRLLAPVEETVVNLHDANQVLSDSERSSDEAIAHFTWVCGEVRLAECAPDTEFWQQHQ